MLKRDFCYSAFTPAELEPQGWLRSQLEVQARGLSGNLDLIWPDVRDSAWIGGSREGWERVPYWLDGFIPLAYLLGDKVLQARAQRYIEAILANQQPDGWLCPCTPQQRPTYDLWAHFLICKVLVVYYECTADARIEKVLYRAMQALQKHMRSHTLFNWGASRWFECLIPLYWLYDRVKEEWIIDLCVSLCSQGLSYPELFSTWRDAQPRREWSYQTHVVNLAMALKSQALYSRVSGEDPGAFAEKMLEQLQKYHGTAVGHFTGDECLSGTSPVQGTELCGVAEAMYSYELLTRITGSPVWADRAEMLAFNAFPATVSPDMWTHQYDQMTNQIACAKQQEPPVFGTNSVFSNMFGLEPNFGCCTANFSQAWPKFAQSAFMHNGSCIVCAMPVPCRLRTRVENVPVEITLKTDYPFRNTMCFTVRCEQPVGFRFGVRIPGCAQSALLNQKPVQPGTIHFIEKTWNGEETLQLELTFTPTLLPRPNGLYALRRGPLVYAVPIAEKKAQAGVYPGRGGAQIPLLRLRTAARQSLGIRFLHRCL